MAKEKMVSGRLADGTNLEADLSSAIGSLEFLQQLIDSALSRIKADCTKAVGLDNDLLDNWQLSNYDLAFCVAELEAARAFSDYATKTTYHSLTPRLALFFIAEKPNTAAISAAISFLNLLSVPKFPDLLMSTMR